jgi:hypothetical protein
MVVQSFCGWPYARSGRQVKSEEDPLDPNPPREQDDIQPFTMLAVGYRF